MWSKQYKTSALYVCSYWLQHKYALYHLAETQTEGQDKN